MDDEKLNGNLPSWEETDRQGNPIYHYTTNYGQVVVNSKGNLTECIYGLGRNQGATGLEVQIEGNYFRVSKSIYCGPIEDELINHTSMTRSYAGKSLKELPVSIVLNTLMMDEGFSYTSILVKKTLLKLILHSFKLSKGNKDLCKMIFENWRKPITGIKRTPIVLKGGIYELQRTEI